MQDFFTLQTLATLGGASIATGLIVQLLKDHIPLVTQILSYLVALVILLAATFFLGAESASDYALCLMNAVIVSGTASNSAAFIQRVQGKG